MRGLLYKKHGKLIFLIHSQLLSVLIYRRPLALRGHTPCDALRHKTQSME